MRLWFTLSPIRCILFLMSSSRRPRHCSAAEKYAAVHRVLRGEALERVAVELNISVDRLRQWERVFLEAGRQRLARHHDSHSVWYRCTQAGRRLMPWGGLLLLLVVIVYAATRFFQQGAEP